MILDWTTYNDFLTCNERRNHSTINREDTQQLVQDLVSVNNISLPVGRCIEHGLYSQTIVHIDPQYNLYNDCEYAIKIYRTAGRRSDDSQTRWLESTFDFHKNLRQLIPSYNVSSIQKVFAVGYKEINQTRYAYCIQQWIPGVTIRKLIQTNISFAKLRDIIKQMFLVLIIPSWSQGAIWDGSDATNFIYHCGKLTMIDTDMLVKTAPEIINNPDIFNDRNWGMINTIARCGKMFAQAMVAAFNATEQYHAYHINLAFYNLWNRVITPTFTATMPREDFTQTATQAYNEFMYEFDAITTNGVSRCISNNLKSIYEGCSSW